jgi:hypothetical protein
LVSTPCQSLRSPRSSRTRIHLDLNRTAQQVAPPSSSFLLLFRPINIAWYLIAYHCVTYYSHLFHMRCRHNCFSWPSITSITTTCFFPLTITPIPASSLCTESILVSDRRTCLTRAPRTTRDCRIARYIALLLYLCSRLSKSLSI